MYDFSTLISKVDALKAKIEQSSITPLYLGSLLNDFLLAMHGIDMTDMPASVSAALEKATDALEQASAAMTAAQTAQTAADAAITRADNNTKLIKQLQGNLQIVDWVLKSVSAGTAAPDSVKAKMRRVNAWSSEEDEREIVLLTAATEEAAGAMTAQHVKDLAALKNDAYEVILFDHIEQSNIAANTSKAPLSASADGCKVVYCRERERFLFGVPAKADSTELTYYTDWEGSERYGTVDSKGVKPAEGKLFIDIAEDNGNLLDIYIFREGALRQTGRSLYDYINDTAQSLSALENSKGKADGLAPLDADKLIPEANIPQKYDNIIFFDSVQDGAIVTEPGSALLGADDEKATLIFSKARNRFVLGVAENAGGMPQKYYVNFPGSDRYGTPKYEGIRPASDKVYICRSTSLAYVWNGTTLAALVADYSSEFQNISADILEINESKGEPNGLAPLNADGVVPNENISDEARKSLFCDLFNAAAGTAGYAKFTNGVWDCKLNGLTLSYDEAVATYEACVGMNTIGAAKDSCFYKYPYRTTFPIHLRGVANAASMFGRAENLEVVTFYDPDNVPFEVSRFDGAFNYCGNIHTINGVFNVKKAIAYGEFYECRKLRNVQIAGIAKNFSILHSPLLTLASVDYLITNAANGNTAITITVHANVYAKLTGDTTNEAAAALTADELSQWQALLTKAAGKHIAFASA